MATDNIYRKFGVLQIHKTKCQTDTVNCNNYLKHGVALIGRNRTGPPCSVSCQTAHAPGPPDGSVTDDADRQQTPASKTILAH